jgi:hypothetical protein
MSSSFERRETDENEDRPALSPRSAAGGASAAGPPETVHVAYHGQQGKLDEFSRQ